MKLNGFTVWPWDNIQYTQVQCDHKQTWNNSIFQSLENPTVDIRQTIHARRCLNCKRVFQIFVNYHLVSIFLLFSISPITWLRFKVNAVVNFNIRFGLRVLWDYGWLSYISVTFQLAKEILFMRMWIWYHLLAFSFEPWCCSSCLKTCYSGLN